MLVIYNIYYTDSGLGTASACTFPTLRHKFSAAATMPREISSRWTERFGRPVYEGYGFMVYPAEIEQILYRHPAVRELAIYGISHS